MLPLWKWLKTCPCDLVKNRYHLFQKNWLSKFLVSTYHNFSRQGLDVSQHVETSKPNLNFWTYSVSRLMWSRVNVISRLLWSDSIFLLQNLFITVHHWTINMLLLSFSYCYQFLMVPKWSHLAASTVLQNNHFCSNNFSSNFFSTIFSVVYAVGHVCRLNKNLSAKEEEEEEEEGKEETKTKTEKIRLGKEIVRRRRRRRKRRRRRRRRGKRRNNKKEETKNILILNWTDNHNEVVTNRTVACSQEKVSSNYSN